MELSYRDCRLCPRQCGANRASGQLGYCRMPGALRVARAAPHYWEEPVLSGGTGSGTVFFSGCTLRCTYCQNAKISTGGFGKTISSRQLRELFEHLIDAGVQNINLVTPTHFLPEILPALTPRLPVPVVYNCGGYERVETLRALEGLVDVYLPDYKYSDSTLAARLSGAADYPEAALVAIREMIRQTGAPVLQDGALVRGTLVRHLVLPGAVDNSLGAVEALAGLPRGQFLFSLMSQYTPMPPASSAPPMDRRVTEDEYAAVLSWAWMNGLETGFRQDFDSAARAYIPDFSLQGMDKPWEDML